MPTGSTLENTDKIVKALEERLKDFPEKKDLICRVREKEANYYARFAKDYQKIGKQENYGYQIGCAIQSLEH